jgi:hypothetical protein
MQARSKKQRKKERRTLKGDLNKPGRRNKEGKKERGKEGKKES